MSKTSVKTVKIVKVTDNSVVWEDGVGASKSNFIDAKVGQIWEIIVTDENRYAFGVIVNTKLIQDVE